ncbi:MAG: hypothetical protein ACRBN8_39720 [Nannocystales bacterium]
MDEESLPEESLPEELPEELPDELPLDVPSPDDELLVPGGGVVSVVELVSAPAVVLASPESVSSALLGPHATTHATAGINTAFMFVKPSMLL